MRSPSSATTASISKLFAVVVDRLVVVVFIVGAGVHEGVGRLVGFGVQDGLGRLVGLITVLLLK